MSKSHLTPPPGLLPVLDSPDAFDQFVNFTENHYGQAVEAVERYQQEFRRIGQERDKAFKDLVRTYKQLLEKYNRKCQDFENEVEARRMWHTRAVESQRQRDELKLASESNPFAMVILDGDGAIFRDDLVAKGHQGGVDAAHLLLTNIKDQLKNIYPQANVDDWSIVVQIAMSVPGVAKKLLEVGIIQTNAQLVDFTHGFTYSQPLFSIVDVGKGKERADQKCREMARLMHRVKQCKHLFFGPCNDTGYIPALQFLRDPGVAPHVTLVETLPALPGFRELGLPFTRFPAFRSTPLPDGAAAPRVPALPSQPQALPAPVIELPINSRAAAAQRAAMAVSSGEAPANGGSTNGTSWAAMSKNGAIPNSKINIAPAKKPSLKFVLLNKDLERVDDALPRFDPAAEKRYQARKQQHGSLCNEFHLKGADCDPAYCSYYHGERLNKAEALVLHHKARGGVCNYGSSCTDPDCYYGHHCKYGRHCTSSDCRFATLHHVDLTACYRQYEDGRREKIT